jgi:hypothetical protein
MSERGACPKKAPAAFLRRGPWSKDRSPSGEIHEFGVDDLRSLRTKPQPDYPFNARPLGAWRVRCLSEALRRSVGRLGHPIVRWWAILTIDIKIAARTLLCRLRFQIDLWGSLRAPSEYPCDTHGMFRRQLVSEKRMIGIAKSNCEVSRQTDN